MLKTEAGPAFNPFGPLTTRGNFVDIYKES